MTIAGFRAPAWTGLLLVLAAAGAQGQLTFSPASTLPTATTSTPYLASISVSGGASSYSWSVSGLPTGLSAVGSGTLLVITGTPVFPGSTSGIQVTVTFTLLFTQFQQTEFYSMNVLPGALAAYSTPAAWQSASSGTASNPNFGNLAGNLTSVSSVTLGGVTFSGNLNECGGTFGNTNCSGSGGFLIGYETVTADPPPTVDVTSAGGTFGAFYGNAPQTLTITGTTFSGVSLSFQYNPGNNLAFAGFVSSNANDPIQSVTYTEVGNSGNYAAVTSFPFYFTAYPALTISTGSPLPAGTTGQAYSFTMTASGGTGYYSWSASGLPAGLSMSAGGVITGTPTAAGTSAAVAITLHDTRTGNATQNFFSITIDQATTTSLTSSLTSPSTFGSNLTLTATVTPGTATGKVTFFDGITPIGDGTLSSGVATLSTPVLGTGKHKLKAYYQGAGIDLASTSPTLAQNINSVAQTGFGAGASYSTGPGTSNATFVVAGDFNRDGKPDIAMPNYGSGNVSVFLGDGTGALGTPSIFPVGQNPFGIAVGDFNGDGKSDLAVANLGSNNVSILLGDGLGGFGTAVNYSTGSGTTGPTSIAVADFDGDGIADLAVANYEASNVAILLGTGTGAFGAPTLLTAGTSPFRIIAADFNGDGIADLATANYGSNNISVLLGQGSGRFAAAVPYSAGANAQGTIALAAGDFNGGGKLDLAVANYDSSTVGVLLGTGTGTFGAATSIGVDTGPYFIAAGDFNGDGKADVAVPIATSAKVAILLGLGAGALASPVDYTAASANSNQAVAIADFNGDGVSDLAIASANSKATIMLGLATTTTTLTSSVNPTIYNQNTTLTATVSPSGATGTATFYDGVTAIGSAPLSGGVATLSISTLTGGQHGLTATYGGASTYASSTSLVVTQVVNRIASSTALTSAPSPAAPGQNVTLTASITPSYATGTVTFKDGGTQIGLPQTISGGVATLTTATLSLGSHTLTAVYSGDGNVFTSSSPPAAQAIQNITTNVLNTSVNPAGFGQSITFAAVITPGTATGTVNFTADGNSIGSATLNFAGIAMLTTSSLSSGSHLILATYLGDANDQVSVSEALLETVKASSTTSLSTAPTGTATFGSPVTLIATVSPATPGQVTFYDGAAVLGTSSLSSGTAVLTTDLLAAGAHQLTGYYLGNATTTQSTSSAISETVQSKAQNGFATGVTYPLGSGTTSPTHAVVGDFNGDGKPDLAVADYNSSSVSVFLGNGDGTLGTPSTFFVGSNPLGIAVADFNGDGKSDLAVTNSGNGNITILLGNGVGGFGTAGNYNTGMDESQPYAVVAADFNGDGIPDLALANYDQNNVVILTGTGTGSFSAPQQFISVGTEPFAIVAGDFNGDGIADLATANYGSANISVMLGQSGGQFSAAVPYSAGAGANGTRNIVAADLDGDGNLDLAVANFGSSTVSVLIGTGLGTFGAASVLNVDASPVSVAVGDFNGDGKADLAVPIFSSGNVSILLGDGRGGFGAPIDYSAGTGAAANTAAVAADFNGDGVSDLGVSSFNSSTVSVMLGLAATTTSLTSSVNPTTYNQGTTLTATVTPASATGTVTFYDGATALGTGTLSSGSATLSIATLTGGMHTLTATYGGATAYAASTSAIVNQAVLQIGSTTLLTSAPNPSQSGQNVTLTATITPSYGTGQVTFYAGEGEIGKVQVSGGVATISTAALSSGINTLSAFYTGDLNVLGGVSGNVTQTVLAIPNVRLTSSLNPALVGQNVTLTASVWPQSATGTVTFEDGLSPISGPITLVNGSATFSTASLTAGAHSLTVAYSGDSLDTPATSTVLTQNIVLPTTTTLTTATPANAYFGQAVSLTATVTPSAATGNIVFFDGATMLGSGPISAGSATLSTALLGSGARTLRAFYQGSSTYGASRSSGFPKTVGSRPQSAFGTPVNYATGPYTITTAIGDFNGDGKQDLAVLDYGDGGVVTILLGNGDGTFQTPQIYSAGYSPAGMAVGDFNGDGKQDIVIADGESGIAVLLGNGDGTFGMATEYSICTANSVAVADFNNDGIADLAIGSSGKIDILRGAGDGSFIVSRWSIDTVGNATVFAADMNSDGNADLVYFDDQGNLAILLGIGDGRFQSPNSYTPAGDITSLAVSDFNGDGSLDVVVGTFDTWIYVLPGNGDGTLGGSTAISVGGVPDNVATGDANGDGKQDIVVADSSFGTVSVVPGNGDGTFGTISTTSTALTPAGLVVGNFSGGSGRVDLALPNGSTDDVDVMRGLPAVLLSCPTPNTPVLTGVLFSMTCTASDGITPYTYTVQSGTLPTGLSLNSSTGAIGGTPSATGSFTFTIQATDSDMPAQSASVSVTLFVATPLVVAGATLPAATFNAKYSTAAASGGTPPYICSLISGRLPTGISLAPATCVLSGTPTAAPNTFSFTIGITDSGSPQQTGSQTFSLTVQQITTTTALVSSVNPTFFGQSTTLTAQVTPSTATGTVTFKDGPNVIGTAAPISGLATFTTSTLSVGNHSLTASYGGDTDDASSLSTALTQTVTKAPTTTTLGISPNPSTYGQNVTLTATVAPATATGTVTFYDGTTTLGTGTLNSSGVATLNVATLLAGRHALSAAYSGDANDLASALPALVTLGFASPAPGTIQDQSGNGTGFIARLPGTGTSFPSTDSNLLLSGGALAVSTTDADLNGQFGLPVAEFLGVPLAGVGVIANQDFSVSATFNNVQYSENYDQIGLFVGLDSAHTFRGGFAFLGAPVTFSTQTVNGADTSSFEGGLAPNPGDNVVLTISRTAGTWAMSIQNLTTPANSGSISLASQPTFLNGTPALVAGVFAVDSRNTDVKQEKITAFSAMSPNLTVNPESTTTALTSSLNPSTFGQSVTLTASVSPIAATGTITFMDGATTLGTGTLINGSTTLTLSTLATASHTLTAVYGGDANNLSSTSPVLTQVVNPITTTTSLFSSTNPSVFGQAITLAATVTPGSATGTVTFYEGATVLGTSTVFAGVANLTISTLAVGSNLLTAVYGGDTNDAGSTSTALNQVVNQITTTTTLSSSGSPTTFGQSVTLTANVAPISATGRVEFYDGPNLLGVGSLLNGQAFLATRFLGAGNRSLKAYYTGDVDDHPSASSALPQVVNALAIGGYPAPAIYTAANQPVSMAQADFNRDGITDLVVVDQADTAGHGTVEVFLGNANGTFQTPSQLTFPAGQNLDWVATGDFNGDGKADLAVAGRSPGKVFVLLGDGTGGFGSATEYSASAAPNQTTIAVGDFNGDGLTDLAISGDDGAVTLLLGIGAGMFGSPVSYPAGANPYGVTAGDFNGDGFTDLAFANFGADNISILLGHGDGTFALPATYGVTPGSGPFGIVAGDLNGDGFLDIAATNLAGNGSGVSILLGTGDGTFGMSASYFTSIPKPASVALGDFNADGKPDLAIASFTGSAGSIYVLQGNGLGGFTSATTYTDIASTLNLVVGDFNGDGRPDIAAVSANSSANNVSVLLGLGLTTTSITSSINPSTFGLNVTLTATVSPVGATGTVTFQDGSTALGTSTLSSGTATFSISTLSVAGHSITAVYNGDSTYFTSTSAPLTQTVNQAPTSVNLTSSLNPSMFGQNVTFTATLSASGATGMVTFLDGLTTLGTSTVAGGVASFSTAALSVATHSITAVYAGDSSYLGSVSSAVSQVVNQASTTTALTSSVNPSTYDQSVTFTATLSASGATGTVTFKDGATTLGTGTLSGGATTFSTAALLAATHSITAVYSGDGNYLGSVSLVLSQVVNQASTTTSVTSSVNPSTFGQSVMFTATVSGAGATGTVTFKDGATTLGTGTLSSGTATFSTAALSVAAHSITAVYSGDSNYQGSGSLVHSQVVNQASTTTSLTSSVNPSTFGQNVTFTATVSASGATGNVTFMDGSTTLGTGAVSSGTATFTTGTLSVTIHSITAVYGGDASYLGSTSPSVSQVVNRASTTTALISSLNPSTFGQSVTFTATVSAAGATGTVTFMDGSTTLGTGTLSSGSAVFQISSLTAGSHSITASYGGDASYSGGVSSAVSQVVNQATTTTTITSSANPSVYGQSVTFTATVSPSTATGSVTFMDGSTNLGSGTLSGGIATFTSSTLAVSTHTLSAVYAGDANNTSSTSSNLSQLVNPDPTTTLLTFAPNPSTFGQGVTLTASVTPSNATGTITFSDGSTTLGTQTLSGGTATFSTAALSVGSHVLTAAYGGDTNDSPSASQTALALNFMSAPSGTVADASGQGTGFAVRLPGTGGSVAANDPNLSLNTSAGKLSWTTTSSDPNNQVNLGGSDFLGLPLSSVSVTASGDFTISATFRNVQYSQNFDQLGVFVGSSSASMFRAGIVANGGLNTQTVETAGGVDSGITISSALAPNPADDVTISISRVSGTWSANLQNLTTPSMSGSLSVIQPADLNGVSDLIAGVFAVNAENTTAKTETLSAVSLTGPLEVVNQAASGTALTSSANPSSFGQPVTFTATVSPSTATGTVAFMDGSTMLGTGTLSGGTATFGTAALSVATHSITAVYSGDVNYLGSSSSALGQVVNQASTTTSVMSSVSPSTFGQSVTFTATVSAPGATGTVTFKDGATTLGTSTLSAGVANFSTAALIAATHSITAVYGGDSNYLGSGSSILSQIVNQASTTTGLTPSVNPSTFGQSVTFTATVSGAGATGTVTFEDGATTLGTGPLSGGTATFSTAALTAATHSITAVYGGDSNYLGSGSSIFGQVVNQASTTTTLTSSVNPSTFGGSVTFTATVSASGATGTVTFKDGATTLGTGTLSGGTTTFSTAALTAATHSITAVYSGDSNYLGSGSSVLSQMVNQASTGTTLTSSVNPSAFGQSVTLTAMVSPSTATGTVTFMDGSTTLGTGTLNGGTATFGTAALSVATHSITAVYSGDVNYLGSSSAVLGQVVNQAPTTTSVMSSVSPSTFGQSVTFTATVSAPGATGTVTFKDGATTLGTGTLSGGTTTFSTAALSVSTHSITAVYAGDSNYLGSASSILSQVVNQASTTTSLTSSVNPSTFGQNVMFTATVSAPGATGTVTFMDGSSTLGTSAVSSGTATFSTSLLSVATHSITAVYGGDASYLGSTSPAVSQVVNQASTTTSLTSSVNPSTFGQNVTFTATVSASGATGSVTFMDGSATLGTGTLTSGVATFSIPTLSVASHSITAMYPGDINYTSSTSTSLSQTVGQAPTTTILSTSPNPSSAGQAVRLLASVSPSNATGTITFRDGEATLGTGTLSGGTASLSVSTLSVGPHILSASYGGDVNDTASISSGVSTILRFPAQTTGTITDAAGTGTGFTTRLPGTGASIRTNDPNLRASISNGVLTMLTTQANPDGQVNLTLGDFIGLPLSSVGVTSSEDFSISTPMIDVELPQPSDQVGIFIGTSSTQMFRGGVANLLGTPSAFTVETNGTSDSGLQSSAALAPSPGDNIILTLSRTSGVYSYRIQNLTNPTKSGAIPITQPTYLNGVSSLIAGIYAIGPTDSMQEAETFGGFAMTGPGQLVINDPTTTTLTSSANPAVARASLTLTATVTPSTATGMVTFTDGTVQLGTVALSGGMASLSTSSLAAGSHSLTAFYGGDINDDSSTSAVLTQAVNSIGTVTTISSSPNPAAVGQSVALSATVSPVSATGTVTFSDGGNLLATVSLASGTASYSTSSLSAGSHSITAAYSGDANDTASTSPVLTQIVSLTGAATAISSSANPGTVGQAVTFTATVTPAGATGTITFSDGGSALGSVTLSGGTAALTVSSLAFGTHSITATYGGDSSHGTSTSAVLSESMVFTPLSIGSVTLPAGTVGQSYGPVSFSATGGSGKYSFSSGGLPAGLSLTAAGSLGGTPTGSFSGSIPITVTDTVSNLTASASFSVSIVFTPISVSGPGNLGDVVVGGAVSGGYAASGGLSPYTWSISGGSGLSIDGNGNVGGAPTAAGSFTLTISVQDSAGNAGRTTASLSVLGIATGSLPAATTTSNYSASISVIGGIPPYTFSASGLPTGITFAAGTFGGKATAPGTPSITVQVTDAKGVSVSATYTLTITGPTALEVTSTSLSNGTVGQPYSQVLSASGGLPVYTWAQSGGALPAGLSLSSSGTISGAPTTPGTSSVGVQVTDSSGGQAVGTVSIVILPAPIQITSPALPSGLANAGYPPQILSASGGVPPYTFSITGALPPGLSLTGGQISGTPTTAGTSTFTIVATDSQPIPATGTQAASITIGPNVPNLVLSAASASFTITSGTPVVPTPSTIAISSSFVADILNFSITSSVPWVDASGSSSTPGSITVGLNSAALALSAAGSPYSGTVTVTCTSTLCAGKSQVIQVNLTVMPAPPQLNLSAALLSFTAISANPQSSSATLTIANTGGGLLNIDSVTAADTWVSIGAFPATVAPGPGAAVTITVNPTGLGPGYYRTTITVNTSASSASLPVTLFISGSSSMTLGPAGTQFSMSQGGSLGISTGSFLVSVTSASAVNFTTAVQPGADWLTVNSTGGSASGSSSATVNFSINQSAAAALAAGAYYGTIRVTASGVANSPLDFQVVLNVSPASTQAVPDPEPAGLIFLSSGASALPAQTVSVLASSQTAVTFQASASVIDGSGWLSISPSTGSSSSSAPGQVSVTANPAGLPPGFYRGGVSFSFSSSAVRTVNVTLIVLAPLPATSVGTSSTTNAPGPRQAVSTTSCSGPQLVPTHTGLVSNFSTPASWPTPLAITLIDTCGGIVNNGQVVTTFSNGDPPLALTLVDPKMGLYSGTWTPRNTSAQIVIQARATAPGYNAATAQIAGQVSPNAAPVLAPNGTTDVFNPQVGGGLGPGNIVQIYGSGLAAQVVAPSTLPLPTAVIGTSVLIGGVSAPLYYISPGQINAQIPFELAPNQQYQVIVVANGAFTTPQPIHLNAGAPSVLAFTSGAVIAQHADGSLITASSPAAPGEYIVIYLTGLGATDVNVTSGSASPSTPLARVIDVPVLTLNNNRVDVLFAGLTPGLVGLYQINFQLPANLTSGNYTLLISQSGTVSNSTLLQVQQ